MTTINTDLSDFLLPSIPSLQSKIGFGTTVPLGHNNGSLTVTEFAEDLALIYKTQGMQEIAGENNTTEVVRDCRFIFTEDNSSLNVNNATKPGLKVEVTTAASDESLLTFEYISGKFETISIKPNMTVTILSCSKKEGEDSYCWKINSIEFNGSKLSAKDTEGTLFYSKKRWLRFDPNNKRGLIIAAGTFIRANDAEENRHWLCATEDMSFDVSNGINANRVSNYNVFLDFENSEAKLTISTNSTSEGRKIGRFHTLCSGVGTISAKVPTERNSDSLLLVPYKQEEDPDFYNFYNKEVTVDTSITGEYSVGTVEHPLNGFIKGDILPESIWCLSFKPDCLKEDAMCYNKFTNTANDVYLMSGNSQTSASIYDQEFSTGRPVNLIDSLRTVGKKPLTDLEFSAAAFGSNEGTEVYENSSRTGGHVDDNSRRMISFIGLEDCCGLCDQILNEYSSNSESGYLPDYDGTNVFGKAGNIFVLAAGGSDEQGDNCGYRSRNTSHNLSDSSSLGIRGSCSIA